MFLGLTVLYTVLRVYTMTIMAPGWSNPHPWPDQDHLCLRRGIVQEWTDVLLGQAMFDLRRCQAKLGMEIKPTQ